MPGVKAIDTVVNIRTPRVMERRSHQFVLFESSLGKGKEPTFTLEETIEKMDRAGIEKAFLIAVKIGSPYFGFNDSIPYSFVTEAVAQYPDRFLGLAGIDPYAGMEGVRELEEGIKEHGFIGAHVYPHWFYLAPDHRKYYPFYAKCVELDIPIQMQVGHCLIYVKDRPPMPSVGRPILLDTIACDFPDLKLIGIHTGWPWVEEMMSVAFKHPNVYVGSDAHSPKNWKPEFVHFINTWGKRKVLFGTDFPVVDFERAMREIADLNLRPDAERLFLRENALRVYGLDG